MGRKKILSKLSEFFQLGLSEKQQKIEDLLKLLDNLKGKEKELIKRLEAEKDAEEIKSLKKKIDTVHTYRKKGIDMMKTLKKD
ncbi:MAG: hypothetical protein ISR69_09790 [Gammaproteobacteria bacterium]|nr:hypothetical protein [Gammaproteobacteria bacterium]